MAQPNPPRRDRRRIALLSMILLLGFLFLIQLIPYGRNHANPPTGEEPRWDSPQTRRLVEATCFDCHSHQTKWPWYSWIAPVSWLVQHDVDEGREHLNFQAWERPQKHAKDAAEEVAEGEMPPWFYLPLHPHAQLTDADRKALIAGLEKTLGKGSSRAERKASSEE